MRNAIEILLKNNADVNAKTRSDMTVWQLTLKNSNIHVLKFLITKVDIDFSFINASERSFLHYLA